MISIRSGNILLRHWVVSTDNFLLTDLPGYVLGSVVLGTTPFLLVVVPLGVFRLMLTSCLALVHEANSARTDRTIGYYLVFLLLGIPWGDHFSDFFWSDYHVATVTVCLLAVLAASPALSGRTTGRLRLACFALFVFAAAFSDPLTDILLCGPILLIVALRAGLGSHRLGQGVDLAVTSLVATAASLVAKAVTARADFFVTVTSVTLDPVRDGRQLLFNLWSLAVLSGIVINGPPAFAHVTGLLPRLIGASRLLVSRRRHGRAPRRMALTA